eukprot:scaffold2509_cov107-Isochrysis_galbana.AAC.3
MYRASRSASKVPGSISSVTSACSSTPCVERSSDRIAASSAGGCRRLRPHAGSHASRGGVGPRTARPPRRLRPACRRPPAHRVVAAGQLNGADWPARQTRRRPRQASAGAHLDREVAVVAAAAAKGQVDVARARRCRCWDEECARRRHGHGSRLQFTAVVRLKKDHPEVTGTIPAHVRGCGCSGCGCE